MIIPVAHVILCHPQGVPQGVPCKSPDLSTEPSNGTAASSSYPWSPLRWDVATTRAANGSPVATTGCPLMVCGTRCLSWWEQVIATLWFAENVVKSIINYPQFYRVLTEMILKWVKKDIPTWQLQYVNHFTPIGFSDVNIPKDPLRLAVLAPPGSFAASAGRHAIGAACSNPGVAMARLRKKPPGYWVFLG